MDLPAILSRMGDRHLLALYPIAKTRLRVFFTDPRNMRALRQELIRRGLLP